MTNGFNASVPARKPKTRIGRVLMELTSDTPESAADSIEDATAADAVNGDQSAATASAVTTAPPPPQTPPDAEGDASRELAAADAASFAPQAPAADADRDTSPQRGEAGRGARRTPPVDAPAARPTPADLTIVSTQRHQDRLAALRERLALAAQPPSTESEPKHTAAAVREVIEELRSRVEAAVSERAEVAAALDDTRAALAKAEAELERERRNRADVEARAEERQRVADEAVSEAESLAAERDLVLAELAAQRRLDDEQSALLTEAEAALDRHRAEREAAAREVADVRNLLEVRAAEIADLESRLETEAGKRAKVEARCRELEAEIARLAEAREALDTIEGMVGRRR